MKADVIPILIPNIDFKNLIAYASNFLDRKVSKELDDHGLRADSFPAFLEILNSIIGEKGNINPTLYDTLFFGFLISSTRDCVSELASFTHGHIAKEKNVIICTGSLEDWWFILTVRDTTRYSVETQYALNRVYEFIKIQLRLTKIWKDYTTVFVGPKSDPIYKIIKI